MSDPKIALALVWIAAIVAAAVVRGVYRRDLGKGVEVAGWAIVATPFAGALLGLMWS